MMTQTKRDEITAALANDGDAVETDGRTWVLRLEPDECTSIMAGDDGDWFGEVAWGETNRETGWGHRPRTMNGRAQKVLRSRDGDIWWQPPADVTDAEMLRTMAAQIRDILKYGYMVVVLETDDGRSAAIGGVEPFADRDYMASVVGDLVWEIAREIHDDDVKRARKIAEGAMFAVVGP